MDGDCRGGMKTAIGWRSCGNLLAAEADRVLRGGVIYSMGDTASTIIPRWPSRVIVVRSLLKAPDRFA